MTIIDEMIICELSNHIRVNLTTRSVEIYNEYGVQLVLRNLSEGAFEAFKKRFYNF